MEFQRRQTSRGKHGAALKSAAEQEHCTCVLRVVTTCEVVRYATIVSLLMKLRVPARLYSFGQHRAVLYE
eukprot:484586-Pyramimonas_sp.AAC.1